MKKVKGIPILVLLLVATVTVAGISAFVVHWLGSITASVNIVSNPFELVVYEDEGLTTVATNIEFDDFYEDDPSANVSSTIYYITAPNYAGSLTLYCTWNATEKSGLPEGYHIEGRYNRWENGISGYLGWLPWLNATDATIYADHIILNVEHPYAKIKFYLSSDLIPTTGTENFSIILTNLDEG